MRVGRAPLDEEGIRLIEASNPDVQFDWTRILKGHADPETPPPQERRQGRTEEGRAPRPGPDRRAPRPASAPPARPEPAPQALTELPETVAPVASHDEPGQPMTAAQARLGSEGIGRLRARYAATMARITEQIQDPEQQGRLKELAERLNPDAWVTDVEVTAGLESYESTYEALRGTIGNRRRNPRPEAPDTPLV